MFAMLLPGIGAWTLFALVTASAWLAVGERHEKGAADAS
jgi:hypothetical protein